MRCDESGGPRFNSRELCRSSLSTVVNVYLFFDITISTIFTNFVMLFASHGVCSNVLILLQYCPFANSTCQQWKEFLW